MTPTQFKRSLSKPRPPAGLAPALAALWWAGKDKWNRAHDIVMTDESRECAWVHAYLHRAEDDLPNARYWYRQARRPAGSGPLPKEWAAIVREVLGMQGKN
jgi:hypothetical protein